MRRSGSTILFVTEQDYQSLAEYLAQNGKVPIEKGAHDLLRLLSIDDSF